VPTWWAERAWLGGKAAAAGVVLETSGERLAAVTPGVAQAPAGAHLLAGLTVPGLANAHSHAFHRALRGRSQEGRGNFWTWRQLMYRAASALDPDLYRRLAAAVFGEMALAGFTAVGEFHYVHHRPDGSPYPDANGMGLAVAEAARTAGVRLTLLDTLYLSAGFGAPPEADQRRFADAGAGAWEERVGALAEDAGTVVGAAIHSVRAVPPEAMAVAARWAQRHRRPLHAHVSEQRTEHDDCQRRLHAPPLEVLARAGAFDAPFTAVHGTHLSATDVAQLAAAGAGCCLCPTTEADLGDGIGPFAALAEAGVTLSLGTDSHAMVDGFAEARAVEMGARLAAQERGLIDAPALLGAATAGGAAALGWDAGELAPGRLADFATVATRSARLAGVPPGPEVVFAAGAGDVTSVVVGGRPVVAGGRHLGIADVAGELDACISELWRRAGR
jgi:formiminoglutamate deiminase